MGFFAFQGKKLTLMCGTAQNSIKLAGNMSVNLIANLIGRDRTGGLDKPHN